ncbi:MAG: 2-aminoethylphosphonate aminotransferase [Beggiatoa sp.]|nr:2-aminoethylphosphonate aminotransferase [Beggiatoa sp.]
MILLNPGPVILSPRVRAALMNPDLCHREPEFADLQDEIRARLLDVYGLLPAHYAAVLFTGSGTAAVEAMLTSLIPASGALLVLENGVYGERLTRIAEIHRIPHVRVQHAWQAPLDLSRIAEAIERHPTLSHIALVHHETTTGRLNALADIGALGRAHGLGILVDAVSSFGAEALDFEGLGLTACAATANKCLHGVPGVSFVTVSRVALSLSDGPRRSLYLDLPSYCEAQDRRSTLYTPSVPVFYALREALAELAEEGGREARNRRYRHLLGIARDGLRALGIEPLLPREDCSVVLNAFHLPDGFGYTELHDRLKDRGFVIYAGQGDLAMTLFRVSAMGAISVADMERFVDAVGEAIRS